MSKQPELSEDIPLWIGTAYIAQKLYMPNHNQSVIIEPGDGVTACNDNNVDNDMECNDATDSDITSQDWKDDEDKVANGGKVCIRNMECDDVNNSISDENVEKCVYAWAPLPTGSTTTNLMPWTNIATTPLAEEHSTWNNGSMSTTQSCARYGQS